MHWWTGLARIGFGLGIVAVVALSVAPATVIENVPPWMIFWDKIQHGLAYAAVAGCGGVGFGGTRRSWVILAIALVLLGALLEGVQYFLPTRAFEVADLFANSTGVAIGLLMAVGFLRLVTPTRPPPTAESVAEAP